MSQKIKIKSKKELKLSEGWEKFERYCKIHNLAEDTIDFYKLGYKYLEDFLGKKYMLQKINEEVIEKFIEFLINTEMKNTSINSRLRAVRRYIYYYIEKGYIKKFKISLLKVQKKKDR